MAFNLSEKIEEGSVANIGKVAVHNIKEFIGLLKEEHNKLICNGRFEETIDKLAGEDLI